MADIDDGRMADMAEGCLIKNTSYYAFRQMIAILREIEEGSKRFSRTITLGWTETRKTRYDSL
jgi:hypothetical protein